MNIQCLKNPSFAACLLFASLQADADELRGFHQGFYIGGEIGRSWGAASWGGTSNIVAINDQGVPLAVVEEWTPNGSSSLSKVAGRIFLGYDFVYKPLYLGLEIGATFAPGYEFESNETRDYSVVLDVPANTPPPLPAYQKTLDANARLRDTVTLGSSEFNFDLKPGWLFLKNTLLAYARVGVAVNELSIKSSGTWSNTSTSYLSYQPPLTVTASDSSKENRAVAGIRLGLGAGYSVTQTLVFSLDYIYTDYGYINTIAEASESSFAAHIANPNLSPYYSVYGVDAPEVHVSTQALLLSVLYHW